jgi:putative membrane protein
MATVAAFLHYLGAFALVAALSVELVLMRGAFSAENARRLQRADLIFGLAAALVLVAGLFRVLYFEKGPGYYFQSATFIAKITVFLVVGVASIYPTLQFIAWGRSLKRGLVPNVAPARLRIIRRIIHWELAGVVIVILCATMMAHGVGSLAG